MKGPPPCGVIVTARSPKAIDRDRRRAPVEHAEEPKWNPRFQKGKPPVQIPLTIVTKKRKP